MWWPIRFQIFVPFATILLIAVAATAVSSAYLAARRSEREQIEQLNQVLDTIDRANFPYSENVLLQMRGLSGAEFVTFDADGQPIASTLDESTDLPALDQLESDDTLESLGRSPTVNVNERRFYAATVEPADTSGPVKTLLVLYPESSWTQARFDAAFPPLIIGTVTFVLTILVSMIIAQRISRRIRSVQTQVAAIAEGDFVHLEPGTYRDEIRELIGSVNRMSSQLKQMQQTIRQSERSQLLGQLAGGLAHQLRNAVTGARLAVQLHERGCVASKEDECLSVALRQLELMEEQIRGLLSLGRQERHLPQGGALSEVLSDVAALVGPTCEHSDVDFHSTVLADCEVADVPTLRTAVLNLVLNGIEAAGRGGRVQVLADADEESITVTVTDNGPGPPEEIEDQLFELFVTGKPDGVGFGLALAQQVARELDGRLSWRRAGEQTVFELSWPISKAGATQASAVTGENVT